MRLLLNNQEGRVIKMKNYLFRPFKDDEEKIEAFNHFKSYLPKGHRNELIIFMGSLESYYDVIISKLQSDECESIGWIDQYKKGCEEYRKEIAELKAEIKSLKDGINALEEQVSDLMIDKDKLKAEIDELKERVKERYSFKYVDGLLAEIRTLKAENKELKECVSNEGLLVLQDDNKRLQSIIDELREDNKRLYQEHKECRSRVVDTIG